MAVLSSSWLSVEAAASSCVDCCLSLVAWSSVILSVIGGRLSFIVPRSLFVVCHLLFLVSCSWFYIVFVIVIIIVIMVVVIMLVLITVMMMMMMTMMKMITLGGRWEVRSDVGGDFTCYCIDM